MRPLLTRSRKRFVCRCWSPRIHRRFCCSRRWLSRSPRVHIFGQRLSCGSCWCCPRVNGSSWFGTCKKNQQEEQWVQVPFGKLSLEIGPSQEPVLPINPEHKWEQQLSTRNTGNSQQLCHTLWATTSSRRFWARHRNQQFPSLNLNTNTCTSNKKINLPLLLTLPPQVTIPGWRWPKSQGLFMNSGESEFIKSPKVKGMRYTTLTLGQRNL